MQLTRPALALACFVLLVPALDDASATPLYAARAGRTCDSCHLFPNWDEPKLSERKRSVACQTCHVDPAGGGMRTTAGRFHGQATLPMIATSPRPNDDWDRNLPGLGRRDRATPYDDYSPTSPKTFESMEAYKDSLHDPWAWGTPRGSTRYGPFAGRYGVLNPDPVLRVGGDARIAMLFEPGKLLSFPMQFDIGTAFHPVHHVTALANVGARGRASGYSDTIDDSHTPYFRELLVMTNEWPYQLYAKAGRFVPSYGLKLDDHTNPIRRELELDGSLEESRVLGIEAGGVASFPFVQASWFKMKSKYATPDAWNIFDVDDSWGSSVNLGVREFGWSVGASAMARHRPLDQGGDTDTWGVYGSFNPWNYWSWMPLTGQGEVDAGTFQRASGRDARHLIYYGEVDWGLWNGVNLLFAYDWADPDRDVKDDDFGRYQIGAQVTPYPGFTIDGRVRALNAATATGDGTDFFLHLHIWF